MMEEAEKQPVVVVTGASGLLGRALASIFASHGWKVEGTAYSRAQQRGLKKVDLRNRDEIEKLVHQAKPDVIIHSAALRFPDVVDKNFEEAWKVNVDATKNLADIAGGLKIPLVFISTNYVFDGSKAPYKETDEPNPINKYGKTKLEGERILQATYPESIILRVPVLFGEVEYLAESAVTYLFQCLIENEQVNHVSDYEVRWPAFVGDVAEICVQLADQKLKDPKLEGIFQWCGKEKMTKYEMTQKLAEAFNLSTDHIVRQTEPTSTVARPYNCQMDSAKLEALGIGSHTPFIDAVKRCNLERFMK